MDTLTAPAPAGATAAPTPKYDPTTQCVIELLQSHLGAVVGFDDFIRSAPRHERIDALLNRIVSSHLRTVRAYAEHFGRWDEEQPDDWNAYMRLLRKLHPDI